MGLLTYPDLSPDLTQRLTPYESAVRSTALAHRFMVRRNLAKFCAAAPEDQPCAQSQAAPRRAPQRRA